MDDWDLDSSPRSDSPARNSRRDNQPSPAEPPPLVGSSAPRLPAPVAAAPRRRFGVGVLLGWIAGGLILVLIGALIGFFVARSQEGADRAALVETQTQLSAVRKSLAETQDRSASYYRANEILQAQIADLDRESTGGGGSSSTTVPARPSGVFSDGVFLVGEDIPPGTYDGTVTDAVGYWARLKDTDGAVSSIIANGLPRGPFVLTVIETDKAVELRGVRLTAR
jgi:hypothetical protein